MTAQRTAFPFTREVAGGGEGASPERLHGRSIVLDCRWLGLGGAGRVTELLLKRFATSPPPGRWVLWGDEERVRPLLFAGAAVAPWRGSPLRAAGQADLLRVPAADIVLYGHQIRPLRPGRSVTVIHDTIPLRHGGSRASRAAKRAFLRAAARLSDHVLTDSEFSRRCVTRDLGVPPNRVWIMQFPPDEARAAQVAELRSREGQQQRILYLGRFAPHKNLGRLCRAFARTRFAAAGGTLALVGGWPGEVEAMRSWITKTGIPGIDVLPACGESELDRFLATSRALALPSLEEGFGLPAFEAVASGLPVAVSGTGALERLPASHAAIFDPTDEDAIAAALDWAASRPATPPVSLPGRFEEVVLTALAMALNGKMKTT